MIGQSIIDDADKIVEKYRFKTDLHIDINVPISEYESPTITVSNELYPSAFIDFLNNRGEL